MNSSLKVKSLACKPPRLPARPSSGRIPVDSPRHGDTRPAHAPVPAFRPENIGLARVAPPDVRLKLGPSAPGYVSAYGLEPIDGIGMSFIAFTEVYPAQRIQFRSACSAPLNR